MLGVLKKTEQKKKDLVGAPLGAQKSRYENIPLMCT